MLDHVISVSNVVFILPPSPNTISVVKAAGQYSVQMVKAAIISLNPTMMLGASLICHLHVCAMTC
jgi:hypothetical protein